MEKNKELTEAKRELTTAQAKLAAYTEAGMKSERMLRKIKDRIEDAKMRVVEAGGDV